MAPHILGRLGTSRCSGRAITSEQTGLVAAALPGHPRRWPCSRDARRGHRVLRADRDRPHLPAAHGWHSNAHFRAAYDILVRPKGARTQLESGPALSSRTSSRASTAASACTSITTSSSSPGSRWPRRSPWWATACRSSGYRPAACRGRGQPGRRLYRLRTTWVSVAGHTRIRQPPSYVYLTPEPDPASRRTFGSTFETAAVRGPGQYVCWLPSRTAEPVRPGRDRPTGAGRGPRACTARAPGRASRRSIPGSRCTGASPC